MKDNSKESPIYCQLMETVYWEKIHKTFYVKAYRSFIICFNFVPAYNIIIYPAVIFNHISGFFGIVQISDNYRYDHEQNPDIRLSHDDYYLFYYTLWLWLSLGFYFRFGKT